VRIIPWRSNLENSRNLGDERRPISNLSRSDRKMSSPGALDAYTARTAHRMPSLGTLRPSQLGSVSLYIRPYSVFRCPGGRGSRVVISSPLAWKIAYLAHASKEIV